MGEVPIPGTTDAQPACAFGIPGGCITAVCLGDSTRIECLPEANALKHCLCEFFNGVIEAGCMFPHSNKVDFDGFIRTFWSA